MPHPFPIIPPALTLARDPPVILTVFRILPLSVFCELARIFGPVNALSEIVAFGALTMPPRFRLTPAFQAIHNHLHRRHTAHTANDVVAMWRTFLLES
jgi:hypothetical protein